MVVGCGWCEILETEGAGQFRTGCRDPRREAVSKVAPFSEPQHLFAIAWRNTWTSLKMVLKLG